MGMTIELVDKQEVMQTYKDYQPRLATNVSAFGESLLALPTIEAISKADYENRLKADLVAMLIELQLEIEELDSRYGYDGNGLPTFANDYVRIKKINDIIQQKINSLKEKSNEL